MLQPDQRSLLLLAGMALAKVKAKANGARRERRVGLGVSLGLLPILILLCALVTHHALRPLPPDVSEPWRTRWVVGLLYSMDGLVSYLLLLHERLYLYVIDDN